MATTPTPAPHVSWLKKFGQDILKVIMKINPVEKAIEPVVEAFLPASAVAFNIFDLVVREVTTVEAGYAAITAAPTGVAKAEAVLPVVENLLDQWVVNNLPGSAEILKAEQYIQGRLVTAQNLSNTVVKFLNDLPAPAATVTNSSGVATASVIAQLAKAYPPLAASVTTGK